MGPPACLPQRPASGGHGLLRLQWRNGAGSGPDQPAEVPWTHLQGLAQLFWEDVVGRDCQKLTSQVTCVHWMMFRNRK